MSRNLDRFRRMFLGGIALSLVSVAIAACGAEPTATPQPTATTAPTATSAPRQQGTAPAPTPTRAAPTPTRAAPTATPAPSFNAEAYFKGKTIRIVLGFSPGGGTDTMARYLAQQWPQYIPGKPRIIVSNLTPSPADTTYMAGAKPDGFVLDIRATSPIQDQYQEFAKFKVQDLEYIGGYTTNSNSAMITDAVSYRDIRDAKGGTEKLTLATAAAAPGEVDANDLAAILSAEWLGFPLELKPVAQGNSTATHLLLFERGETNLTVRSNLWVQFPVLRPGWVKDGKVKLFARYSNPDLPFPGNAEQPTATAPNMLDLITPEQKEIWLAAVGTRFVYDKAIITTPGTPKEVVNAYRRAWDAALQDQKFVDGFQRAITGGETVIFITGAQAEKADKETDIAYAKSKSIVDGLAKNVAPKYFK